MPHGLLTRYGIRVLIAAIVLSATAYARNPEDVAPRKDYASVAKALEAFIEWQMLSHRFGVQTFHRHRHYADG